MKPEERPLRVLHLMLSIGETSAAYNEHCLPLADRREISICTYFPSADVTPPANVRLIAGDGSLLGFVAKLRQTLREHEFDIVHTHSPHVGLLVTLLTLFRPDLRRKTVATIHNSHKNFKFRNRLMLLPVFALFRRIVCCGKASQASFPALYRFLAGRRLTAVQNGMDIARAERAAATATIADDERDTVVAIGRLIDIKNPLTLLDAFLSAADPKARLLFIGEGGLREKLVAEIERQGASGRVALTGLVPRDRVYEELGQADIYVSTSRGEGLPVAVLEAMACGRPVILSDIPPHREIADGADFIPLVPPDDAPGFAREIARMLALSPAEKRAIGEKCRAVVREHFSLEAMHRRYPQVYAEVHGRRIAAEESLAATRPAAAAVRAPESHSVPLAV